MADDDLATCLTFVRDWNTTAQHSLTAQRLVYNLLKVKPIGTLVGMPQIQTLLEAIIPYTERHFERIDRLVHRDQRAAGTRTREALCSLSSFRAQGVCNRVHKFSVCNTVHGVYMEM